MEKEPAHINMDEICEQLGIGLALGYKMEKEGNFPFMHRLGRRLIASRKAFFDWFEGRSTEEERANAVESQTRPKSPTREGQRYDKF